MLVTSAPRPVHARLTCSCSCLGNTYCFHDCDWGKEGIGSRPRKAASKMTFLGPSDWYENRPFCRTERGREAVSVLHTLPGIIRSGMAGFHLRFRPHLLYVVRAFLQGGSSSWTVCISCQQLPIPVRNTQPDDCCDHQGDSNKRSIFHKHSMG